MSIDGEVKTKVCTKCEVEKELIDGFFKDKYSKDGHSHRCKICKSAAGN